MKKFDFSCTEKKEKKHKVNDFHNASTNMPAELLAIMNALNVILKIQSCFKFSPAMFELRLLMKLAYGNWMGIELTRRSGF